MNNLTFHQATKEQSKLKLAIFGPSGSGKTYTALRLAKGIAEELNGSVGLIDTEFGSASKYADRFDFQTVNLEEPTVANMIALLNIAGDFDVLIIDSLSHSWKELLDEVNKLARAKYRGNTWSAWSEGTPLQRSLVTAIQKFPSHMITTMRTKTEWLTATENGKSRPIRVGLAPEQGKGIEYEFDMLMEIAPEHSINVIKDRTGKFQDKIVEMPGEDFGKEILSWLQEGVVPGKTKEDLIAEGARLGLTAQEIGTALKAANTQWDPEQWDTILNVIIGYAEEKEEQVS